MRRFAAGDAWEIGGVRYRVVTGKKGPDDLRLEWSAATGKWTAVEMAHAACQTDFFCENEDYLYPPPQQGGQYFMDFLHKARGLGWDAAWRILRGEKAARGAA